MAEEKIEVITFFLIATFLSNLFLNHLVRPQAFAAFSQYEKEMERMDKEEKANKPAPVIVKPKVEYKAADTRDPFKRKKIKQEKKEEQEKKEGLKSVVITESLPLLTIQGIIWGGSVAQAIINNKTVKIGDLIDRVKIVDINKDGVTVFFGNKTYNLSSPGTLNFKKLKGDKDEK